MRTCLGSVVAAAVVLLGACAVTPDAPRAPAARVAAMTVPPLTPPGVQGVAGTLASGARYEVFAPQVGWNGRLIVYAHGYVDPVAFGGGPASQPLPYEVFDDPDPDAPLTLESRPMALLLNTLAAQGFGVAWSARSRAGYAIQEGVADAGSLRARFAEAFAVPARTYLMGDSLGGLIVLALAERSGAALEYAGALPACAPVGGGQRQLEYIGHVRAVFDALFPDALDGNLLNPNPAQDVAEVLAGLFASSDAAADQANVQKAVVMAALDQVRLAVDPADPSTLVRSLGEALYYNVNGGEDLLDRADGFPNALNRPKGNPFDNRATVYSSGGVPVGAVNDSADLKRYRSSPSAVSYVQGYYEPTGNPGVPVLTLHTTLDPQVPFWHEQVYAAKAAVQQSSRVVQYSVNRYGHCAMSAAERQTALGALLAWSELAVKPLDGAVPPLRPLRLATLR